MQWNTFDSMGHVHEVLAGNLYHEQTESVAEQTWSSAAVFDATVRGLLGLTLDAAGNRITLAPHIPAAWPEVSIENVSLPSSMLAFTLRQGPGSVDLDITDQGSPTVIVFNPQIPLGARLLSAVFDKRKVHGASESSGSDEHARVILDVPSGASHLHLAFAGGVMISVQPCRFE